MHLPRSAAIRRIAAALALAAGLHLLAHEARAQVQPNFKPVDKNDVSEVEQKLLVIRGIEVGGDYALRLRENKSKDMPFLDESTTMDQDFRLRLSTVFNEDVAMKLTLQTSTTSLDPNNLRTTPVDARGREPNGQNLQLTSREVYLQWRFNPNSAINLGRFDLELGDKRGKVYRGISSGIGFDCRVGTWCMPFGATKVGPYSPDWIYHWALRYNAYDEPTETGHRLLSVEIFRILYTESNIPLGSNLGPSTYDPANPAIATRAQIVDNCTNAGTCGQAGGNPLYYDATGYNYFGLRVDWQASKFFFNFDFTNSQGSRAYHLFRDPAKGVTTGPTYTAGTGPLFSNQSIDGVATEVNLGLRWAPGTKGQFGVRYMSATGDRNELTVDSTGRYRDANGRATSRGLTGYYEITPGTYRGTRLYFNGADTDVDLGGGLGHSVNNKQVWGVYLDYADPEGSKVGYSGGLYQIDLNDSILNAAGKPVKNVGIELDNMLTWYIHKRLNLQFEANLMNSGGALSVDDNTPPPTDKQLFVQVLARAVYRF